MNEEQPQVDAFDRQLGALHGLPDVLAAGPATVQVVDLTSSATWIVQTFRLEDTEKGAAETVFIQRADRNGNLRIAIPAKVAKVIARQHETLKARARSRAAKAAAQTRKDAGLVPFARKPK